jgi:hypothetical protein
MKNRFTTRYIVIAALFITILAPMTRVHANGALDNTFGNNDPKNGIYYNYNTLKTDSDVVNKYCPGLVKSIGIAKWLNLNQDV